MVKQKFTILKRQFLGKVGNKVSGFSDKQEMAFEKKHLKAYLNGSVQFLNGYIEVQGIRQPNYVKVKQHFYEVETN